MPLNRKFLTGAFALAAVSWLLGAASDPALGGDVAIDVICPTPCVSAAEVTADVATQAELVGHASIPAAHHQPTVDTNAATLCPPGTFLAGGGSCAAVTLRPQFFGHAGNPAAHHVPTVDTNAETICGAGMVLDGDGNCRDLEDLLDRIAALEDLGPRFVFVTSGDFLGDLATEGGGADGLEGGDNLCQAAADSAGAMVPIGTYRAWLSTATVDARDRVGPHFGPFVRPDGTAVANALLGLLDGSLDAMIDMDETGASVGGQLVWTGTLATGLGAGPAATCADWTDGTNSILGMTGSTARANVDWTELAALQCGDIPARLYCFQVTGGS